MSQEQNEGEEAINAGNNSAWMRRLMRDSIYLWACGETADDEDDEPKLSDRLIGWLVLFMQGFAYVTLIVLARATLNSETVTAAGDDKGSGYLLPSVTGAMYLLVASTSHDLRGGYSLLVDGPCAGHRAFGVGLLIVYGIMVSAAMTVLVLTSGDSASVVLNAVTVLFIADLDEKAIKFLSTIPQTWRLFWAIESIGISFVLALVAIVYIGHDSQLLEGNNVVLPNWFIWLLNPTAVTLCSVLLSSTLQAVCTFCSEACVSEDEQPTAVGVMVTRAFVNLFAAIKRAKERVRGEPCFYATLAMWLAQAGVTWFFFMPTVGFPVAFSIVRSTADPEDGRLVVNDDKVVLIYSSVILAAGLAAKAWGIFGPIRELDTTVPEPRCFSGGGECRERWGSCADSRVPSLLIGSGIGYWAFSFIYVLICSLRGSGCRWNNVPSVVSLLGYVIIPCFLVAGILMVADISFLGTRFGDFVKPIVRILTNRRRAEYWIIASVLRDVLVLWIGYCVLLDLRFYY